MRTLLRCFASLMMLLPAAAAGAAVEVTLTGGIRFGDTGFPIEATGPLIVCVTTPCLLADARTEDSQFVNTLIVDVPFNPRWSVEALYTEQDGNLRFANSPFVTAFDPETFDMRTVQVGLLRQWGQGRFRPFAAGLFGLTRFESSARAYPRPIFPGISSQAVDDEVTSWSLAGGLKIDLAKHLALRLEGRGYWHDLPELVGGSLIQEEGSVGLTVKW